MSSTFKRLGQSELLPRYIFAESLVARRRVLEIGAVASTLGQSAQFLSTRGARIVVAADSDLAAVQAAQAKFAGPNLRFRATVFDDFEAGSFDLVIVSDLAPYVRAPELMAEVARLVAKNGYLMGGLRNPAGLALSNVLDPEDNDAVPTYGQLLDALSTHFKSVDVATQSPVLGYQLAFERGEGLQVDGSLAGMSEAAYYVVLAGHEEVRNFDPTWVQLPPEPLAFTGGKLEDAANRARDWRDRTERLKEVLQKKTAELQSRDGDLSETRQQLEATKESVARLTAQLESQRDRPEVLRDREDLAMRVRQIEAELQVARERAIDAEGRVTATRNELEAISRQQKDAAVTALAAHESVRLERARREELAGQLEDGRLRLAKAYEDLRRVQDEAASERVQHERTRIAIERLKEAAGGHETQLTEAKERELKLAEARTESLKAIEGLEAGFADFRRQLTEAREEVSRKEADRVSAVRSLEVEAETRRGIETALERAEAQVRALNTEVQQKIAERSSVETEAAQVKAELERLGGELTAARASEDRWRVASEEHSLRFTDTDASLAKLTGQYAELESKLAATELQRDQKLREISVQVASLESALSAARSTASDLEEQLRISRQNAERLTQAVEDDRAAIRELEKKIVALEQAHAADEARVKELGDDRDALLIERDDLRGALADVEKVRGEQGSRLTEITERAEAQSTKLSELEGALAGARAELDRTARDATSQERALKLALDERQLDLTQLREQLSTANQSISQEQSDRAEIEATLASTRQELEAARGETAKLRESQGSLSDEQAKITATLTDTAAALSAEREAKTALEVTLASTRQDFDSTRAELDQLKDQHAGLGRTRDELSTSLSAERDARAQVTEARDALQALVETAQKNLSSSNDELASVKAENEKLSAELESTRESLTEASTRGGSLAERFTTEQATHEATRAALAEAIARAEKAEAEAALRAQRVSTLERELNELRERAEAAEHARDERKAQVERLEQTLKERSEGLDTTTARLLRLEEERTQLSQSLATAMSEAEHVRMELEETITVRDGERDLRERAEAVQQDTEQKRAALDAELDSLKAAHSILNGSLQSAREELEAAREAARKADEVHAAQRAEAQELAHQKAEEHQAELSRAREAHQAELAAGRDEAARANEAHQTELTAARDAAARAREEQQAELTAAREASARLVTEKQAELEATREASRKALDEKHAEHEEKLKALRTQQQGAFEEQARGYQESLEKHRGETQRALQTREEELKRDIAAAEARTGEVEKQRARLQTSIEAHMAETESAQRLANEKYEALEKQRQEHKVAAERAQSEARGHQVGKLAAQKELDTLWKELDDLRKSLAQAGGESKAANDAREQLEGEVARLRDRVPELEAEVQLLKATQPEIDQLRDRTHELEQQLQNAIAQVSTLGVSDREMKRQLLDAELVLAQAKAAQAEAEAAHKDSSTGREALENELRTLREKSRVTEAEATRLREARLTNEEELTDLRNRTTLLEAQLAEAQRASPTSDDEISGLRRRLPELEAELEIARTTAKNDVAAAQSARQQVEELLLALRVKYGDLQHQATTATEDLAEAKAEAELLEQERERLAARVEELEATVAKPAPRPSAPRAAPPPAIAPVVAKPIVPPLVDRPEVVVGQLEEDEPFSGTEEILLLEDEETDPGRTKK